MHPTLCAAAAAAILCAAAALPLAAAARQPVGDAISAAPAPAALSELARQTLDRAAKVYGDLATYQDRYAATYVYRTKQEPEKAIPLGQTYTMNCAASREGGFRLNYDYGDGRSMHILSDRKLVWAHWPEGSEYIEEPFPADIIGGLDDGYLRYAGQHPVVSVLLRRPAGAADFFRPNTTEITDARRENLGGRPGVRLIGASSPEQGAPRTVTLWFSDETGMIEEVRFDETASYAEQLEQYEEYYADNDDAPADWNGPKAADLASAEWVFTFEDVKLNEPIPAESFVFKPSDSDAKVDQFGATGGDDEGTDQDDLLGRPAPDFSGRLLDDSEFKLDSLRGRVVLMDFWATWCGPCVAAIPSIQKVSEKYADQPVTVIGINSDQGDTERVAEFIKKRKITFTQFMDDGEVGELYGVTGIPCTVLIDKDGVIQDIHVGGSRTLEKDLSAKIDKLLAGERLVDPKPEGAPRARRERPNPDAVMPPIAEDRIARGKTSRVEVMPMGGRGIERESGELLLLPTHDGRLSIVGPGPEDLRTIRLAGIGRSMISSIIPATLGGVEGWVIAMSDFGGDGSHPTVAFFDTTGARVWSCTPDRVKGTFGSAYIDVGNVANDGDDEVVAVFTFMPTGRGGGSSHASYLSVLDARGEIIARKKTGQSAYGVWIARAPESGDAGTILVIGSGVQRYTIAPEQAAAGEPSP